MKIISPNRLLFVFIAYNALFSNVALAENSKQLQKLNTPQQLQTQEINQLEVKRKNQFNQSKSKSETLNKILGDIRDELKIPFYESPLITIFIGFILGLIPALIGNFRTDRKEKNQLSYQLAKEWDSYRQNRNRADEIFVQQKKHGDFSLYSDKEKTDMHIVIEFFDRVNMAKEHNMINVKSVQDYLSIDYKEWDKYFESQRAYYNQEGLGTSKKIYSSLFKGPYVWLKCSTKERLINRIFRNLNLFSKL